MNQAGHRLRKLFAASAVAAAALSLAAPAQAACFARDPSKPGGWDFNRSGPARTFSIEDEFARAFTVVTVSVTSARHLFENKNDPEGLTAHAYRIKPVDTFKGPPLPEFTIYNANSSARFDMDAGRTYVLFVSARGGRSVVDSCGWSDALPLAADTLSTVKALAATNHPSPHP